MQSLIDITLPADQLEGTAAKISHWLVEPGNSVNAGDPIVELETDKVTMEVCAPADGVVETILVAPGEDVEPDAPLGKILSGTQQPIMTEDAEEISSTDRNATAKAEPEFSTEVETDSSARNLVGPAVRRLVRENNLDLELIPGSGRLGRITRDDVINFLKNPQPQQATQLKTAKASPSVANTRGMQGKRIPHTSMRKAIANHMVESLLHTSPHVTSVFEMDMSNIIEHRRWHKKEFADEGVNLTFTAYFLAATVKAMQAVPQMNARFHDDALELFDDINIGVGTALGDEGLVVPVVQQVQHKNLFDIARSLHAQTYKARHGKLTPTDMKNGTFTISNHGVSGSLFAAPIIINQPQVAILGIGKLDKRVVVREIKGEETMQIKPMCYVSLSIDHRAVDAFQTNRFLSVFVETIENWGNQ